MKKVASDKVTVNKARREDETMRNETADKATMNETRRENETMRNETADKATMNEARREDKTMRNETADKATMNEARREDKTMRNETANKVTMSEETTMKVKELAQKFILDDEAKHNIGRSKGYLMNALIEDEKLRMALIEDESLRKMLLEEIKFLKSSKDKYTFRMASMEFEEERQLLPKVENMLHATELTTADPKGAVIWSLGIKLIINNALYIAAGYENSFDYLKEKWGLHTKDVFDLIVFNDTCVEFNSDLNCYTLKPEYRGFNYRQLRELLLVPKEDLKFYSPDMSIRKIRRIKNITLNYSKFDLSDLPDTDDIDNVILSQYLEPRLKAIVGTEDNLRDNVLLYYEKEIHFALNEHIRKNPKYYRGYLNLGYALLQINDHVLYDQTTDILAYSVEQFKMNMSFARGCIDFCRECGRIYKGELHPVLKAECPGDAVLEWVSKLNDLM